MMSSDHWKVIINHALNEAWINDYIHYKVWDDITYPFPTFNDATVEVRNDITYPFLRKG